jgi:ubiquinone/menaquinone biosynthesis C-methylase UbiE
MCHTSFRPDSALDEYDRPMVFDRDAVREAWDRAAESYADGQAAGLDFYRCEFFGPAHAALCGDVAGLLLLDVGCGSGYFSREMAARGAHVTGVDISSQMIARAREHERSTPLRIEYVALDAAELADIFRARPFDIATSCLALQDMPDPPAVFRSVHAVLRPARRFVVSIEHPCTNPPFRAWERDAQRRKRWLCIDRYFDRGPREYTWTRWPSPFTTTALHATMEDWFEWMRSAGFAVDSIREPQPDEAAVRARPALADAARVPYFLMFDLRST